MIAIGLVLGIASIWWERSSRKDGSGDDELLDADALKVRARGNTPTTTAASAPVIVSTPTWQPVISQAIKSGATPADQAKNLMAQFPTLPPAGQFEAANHISNLLPDESYATWAGYLTNASIPQNVRGVIYADLQRRPNSIRLPTLLQVARSSSSQASDAAQLLRNTLGDDYGNNWNAWSARIQDWLKSNPDPVHPGIPGTTVGN
ncbi:MAG TPA: hypothetical protein VFZ59_09940 [Verrucomicrobiae bacterium]|nr:hypothetical protein [Verrucomicrobiae bacterium]